MTCDNCGASVPRDLGACPQCGVFVRVVAPPSAKKRGRTATLVLSLLLLAAAVAAGTYFLTRPAPGAQRHVLPIRVVKDRPGGARVGGGAKINEPEAILRLQRSFALKPECIAILSNGYRDGAYQLTAVNRCDDTRLGRWNVDGKSGAVSKHLKGQ